jgi:hypothetical protein
MYVLGARDPKMLLQTVTESVSIDDLRGGADQTAVVIKCGHCLIWHRLCTSGRFESNAYC